MQAITEEVIENALRDASAGELSSSELARLLLGYDSWHLLCSEGSNGLSFITEVLEDKIETFVIYTNRSKAAKDLIYRNKESDIRKLRTCSGSKIIEHLPESVDKLYINPSHPPSIFYDKDSIILLQNLRKATEVEGFLENLAKTDEAVQRRPLLQEILDYEDYYILLEKIKEQYILLYAPDPKRRALAAVFTAEDAVRRFEEALLEELKSSTESEPFLRARMSGHELFLRLQNQNLDGIVFNSLGPPKPVGFQAEFLAFFKAQG